VALTDVFDGDRNLRTSVPHDTQPNKLPAQINPLIDCHRIIRIIDNICNKSHDIVCKNKLNLIR